MKTRITIFLLMLGMYAQAQVKVGNNPTTINANSLLELESTNKGFLPPRVALNSITAVAPLTGTVPAGMLVFSTGGTLPDGYYYWNGAQWKLVSTASADIVTKTASTTLLKSETFVLASNNITITLPVVTAADNGLAITVKNVGIATDQVTVAFSGAATSDGVSGSRLYRWLARTFVAYNGNWVRKDKEAKTTNVFDVSSSGSWTTLKEAIDFLALHMVGPSVIRLNGETFQVPATLTINLPYPLTIEGVSYGASIVQPAAGLANLPMFICATETYFKMIFFDGTALASYGNNPGEDAIQLTGSGEYYEIKDCNFVHFNTSVSLQSDVTLWLFETDITDAVDAGVEIAAGASTGVELSASECDFTNCDQGINLLSGVNATVNIVNCTFYNTTSGQVGVNYVPASFTAFTAMFITNNAWNNIGAFTNGFDFSLPSGRDATAFIQNNAGDGDKNPSVYLNVNNNATATNLSLLTTWYKINWDYTKVTSSTCKWTVTNTSPVSINNVNKITFQPVNKRDAYITISGNIITSSNSAMLNIGLVKNPGAGVTSSTTITRYGETTLRPGVSGQPFQFSTVIYLSNIAQGDVFELWSNSNTSAITITVQDLQMLVNTK